MAVLTVTLCILGGLALVGTGGYIWYNATEDDRESATNKQKAEELKIENEGLAQAKAAYEALQTQIANAQTYLGKSKAKFTEGGHVYENEPLAKTEFENCEKNLTEASTRVANVISAIQTQIDENTAFIQKYG